MTAICDRCGHKLTDDDGTSWPYSKNCDWCPECGVTHEPHPDRRNEAKWRVWNG